MVNDWELLSVESNYGQEDLAGGSSEIGTNVSLMFKVLRKGVRSTKDTQI